MSLVHYSSLLYFVYDSGKVRKVDKTVGGKETYNKRIKRQTNWIPVIGLTRFRRSSTEPCSFRPKKQRVHVSVYSQLVTESICKLQVQFFLQVKCRQPDNDQTFPRPKPFYKWYSRQILEVIQGVSLTRDEREVDVKALSYIISSVNIVPFS